MIGSTCSSEEHGLTVLTHKSFTVADLANSCNYIISLGEAEGCASLFAASKNYHGEFSYPERVSWIIRVVFISNTPDPLRQPSYGELSLPYESMLLATWPKFPVAQSDLVFFVLSEGYSLSGYPENPTAYLEYCKSNGTMRREPVLIPDSKVATQALDRLITSPSWQAIKWSYSSPHSSYTYSDEWVISFMRSQIPK